MTSAKYSDGYKKFLDTVDSAKKVYQYCMEEMGVLDKATQDLLHQLELGSYAERRKTATRLANIRKERRRYKDTVELLTPFVTMLGDQNSDKFVKKMREMLGATRKIEQAMENRLYYPRVLTDIEIAKKLEEKGTK